MVSFRPTSKFTDRGLSPSLTEAFTLSVAERLSVGFIGSPVNSI